MTNTRIEVDGLVLADFTDIITDNSIMPEFAMEVVERIDAEEVEVIDRGNVRTDFDLFVVREHAKLTGAEDYRTMLREKLPRVGVLLTKITKDYSGSEKKWFMKTPGIRMKFDQSLGVTTFAEFQITGGKWRSIKPTTT
jgi:hypothetical protein